ncbi:MAG: hypothetical protein ACK5MY_03430 [Jhaorihella sp.]
MTHPLPPVPCRPYIAAMTHRIAFLFVLMLSAFPVTGRAQEEQGKSLMERGAEMFLDGLRREMEPKLEDLLGMAEKFGPAMSSFIEEMGPAFMDLADQVRDWSRYHPPEMLPNGDIIMRRKPDPDGDTRPPGSAPPAPGETEI